MENGLLDEVKKLYRTWDTAKIMVSMQGLGYKEMIAYLEW